MENVGPIGLRMKNKEASVMASTAITATRISASVSNARGQRQQQLRRRLFVLGGLRYLSMNSAFSRGGTR